MEVGSLPVSDRALALPVAAGAGKSDSDTISCAIDFNSEWQGTIVPCHSRAESDSECQWQPGPSRRLSQAAFRVGRRLSAQDRAGPGPASHWQGKRPYSAPGPRHSVTVPGGMMLQY
jgi:hypothetical protein